MKPKRIYIVARGRKNPRWNYARFFSMFSRREWWEPCCLKSKPCWECK